MTISPDHGKLDYALQGIHVPYQWAYADAAARAGASGFVATDVGKLARQSDNNTLWLLTAVTPTWAQVGGAPATVVREAIFTVEGVLAIATGVVRIYNKLGASVTISQVFCAVNTAPTGANLIVDILKNGTTIFTGGTNRPVITATNYTGTTTTIDVPSWADGAYLTMDIAQVGATIAGSNLTVHVIYS